MKWKKLGMIFKFHESPFRERFIGFAQSPQALVLDNSVRIYFSTRVKSKNGKFVSIPQYVEFDKSFTQILDYSKAEIIRLGKTGAFDEHGIFPFSILKFRDKVYAYTTGWTRRVSVSCDTGIGLGISENCGQFFERYYDGPVLTSSLYEPFLVCDAFVRVFNEKFHMWYIYGTDWKIYKEGTQPERTYKIGHAVSDDGINWLKEGRQIISDAYNHESQALPTVIKSGSRYHMFFCHRHSFDFRNNSDNGYRIGYAYSEDMINWIRDDSKCGINTSPGEWDSDMMCYPNIFRCNDNIYLLYNGNEFGRHGFGLAVLEQE